MCASASPVPAPAPAAGQLRRVLPFRTIVSTSTGLAYAAISLLSCVQIAAFLAGDSAWIALLVAGALALLAAFCFSELNALYPTAAGVRQYLTAAFNERTSLTVTYGYVLTVVAVIAADSYVVGQAITYATSYFHLPGIPVLGWIFVILALAVVSNLLGIKIAGLLQDLTTFALLISLAAISLVALAHGGFVLHQPFAALHQPGNLFNAVAVGVFTFSAFEWVTPLSEEINDTTQIPRGMFVALGLLFISYALFTVACTNLIGITHLCSHIGQDNQLCSPVPQMLLGERALGSTGVVWMLLATLFTGVMTFNGGFATASRFLYAAAREATLPEIFAALSDRLVPWFTVVALAVASAAVAVLVAQTSAYNILILVGAVLEALIYTIVGLCVIRLRRRRRDAPRSFRIPLGWTIPIASVIIFGALALAAALNISPSGTIDPLPLAVTLVIFALAFLYARLVVPRLKAAAEARRRARISRRPPRPLPAPAAPAPASAIPETDES
ncbi:MAG TPA: APC family permease [Ktedonobacterales bacterium]